MCSMSHNQIEGDEAGNERKSADDDQTELMECESAVPQVNLMDYSREMIRLAIALFLRCKNRRWGKHTSLVLLRRVADRPAHFLAASGGPGR
jgi:hypothetical protein